MSFADVDHLSLICRSTSVIISVNLDVAHLSLNVGHQVGHQINHER